MYKYYSFDEIDQHKWDSAIHYSPNGNVFAYHWYLKAVWREFGAIIEGDYESIMPLPPSYLKKSDFLLLPELGPYSLNRLTKQKVNNFLRSASEQVDFTKYPINSRIDKHFLDRKEQWPFYTLHMIDSYERIVNQYSHEAKNAVEGSSKDDIKITSGVKPEQIIVYSKHSDDHNNALLRIMYHAMHKGLGWSSAIKSKKSNKFLAISFFINSHNTVHEIFSYSEPSNQYRYILYDLLIRQNAGKPSRIASVVDSEVLKNIGFENEAIDLLSFGLKPLSKIKNWFTQRR